MTGELQENARTLDLLSAVREGNATKMQAALTNPGTNRVEWNWLSRYGTPLHMTAYFGQAALVKLLLQKGADVNLRNKEGDTPLHKAAHTNRPDIVSLMVKEPGIDLVAENVEGLSALDVAKSREIVVLLESSPPLSLSTTLGAFCSISFHFCSLAHLLDAQFDAGELLGKQVLEATKAGDPAKALEILSSKNARLANTIVKDPATGNTILHYCSCPPPPTHTHTHTSLVFAFSLPPALGAEAVTFSSRFFQKLPSSATKS